MKPVNLLPPSERAQQGGSRPGSAYVVLGVLGALLVAVLVYVVTANGVTSKQDELASARGETAAAQARLAQLGAFGDFASMKATRETSVASRAQARIDWERLMRELSRVLPDDVFISSLDATASGGGEAASGSPPAEGSGAPSLKLAGCAPSQPAVATLMVRLRQLNRAVDVTLADATKTADAEGGAGCGEGYAFTVSVAFDPAPAAVPERVPAHLGGGS